MENMCQGVPPIDSALKMIYQTSGVAHEFVYEGFKTMGYDV